MRRRGVSTATSLIALIVIIFLVAGALAYTSTVHFRNIKQVRGAVGQAAETHSELLRIYIHPKNESDPSSEPMLTIFNPSPREVMLKQIVAVKKDGGVLKAGMLPQSLSIPPSSKTTIQLSALGLQFNSFLDAVQTLKVAYLVTARGNSFGSTFGPPPPEILKGQIDYEENSSIEVIYYNVETEYNFSFTNLINITGREAYVAVNSYVLDKEGKILGGIENGQYFTSGLINPGDIPWDGAGVYQVPIWGYFLVPETTGKFTVHYSSKFGGGYLGSAKLQYIEVVAIYPPKWHSPGGQGSAPAPYMRYGTQTVKHGKTYNLLQPYTMNYPKTYMTRGRVITEQTALTFTATNTYKTKVGYADYERGTDWVDVGSPVKPVKMKVDCYYKSRTNYVEVSILDERGKPIPLKLVGLRRGMSRSGGCWLVNRYTVRCEEGAGADVEIQANGFMDKFAVKYEMYDRITIEVSYEEEDVETRVYTATLPAPAEFASDYIRDNQSMTTVTWASHETKSVEVEAEGSGVEWVEPAADRPLKLSIERIDAYVPPRKRVKFSILNEEGQPVKLDWAWPQYCPECRVKGDWVECRGDPWYPVRCKFKTVGQKDFTKFGIKYWDGTGAKVIAMYKEYSLEEEVFDEPVEEIVIEEKEFSVGEWAGSDKKVRVYGSWEISHPNSLFQPVKVESWTSSISPTGFACPYSVKKKVVKLVEKGGEWYPALHVKAELEATTESKHCKVELHVRVTYKRATYSPRPVTPIVLDRIKLVQPLELVKIDAPIVLINRIYYIDKDVQPPPPSGGGGRPPKIPAGCKVVRSYCEKHAPNLVREEGGLSLYAGDAVCVYYYECGFSVEVVVG